RILPAAQPQIELTTTIVVPGFANAASTSSAVRASLIPARANSSRIGITIISGYIRFCSSSLDKARLSLLYEGLKSPASPLIYLEDDAGSRTGPSCSLYHFWHWRSCPLVCGSIHGRRGAGSCPIRPKAQRTPIRSWRRKQSAGQRCWFSGRCAANFPEGH